jgi:Uma2 family endonuclease
MCLSPEEFDAVEDWDELFSYELIHGVVIVNPIPSEGEADPNENLGFLLRYFQATHSAGSILDLTLSERYVNLPDGSRRKPDRVIWTGLGRRPDPDRDVPSIVVEFVSKRKRDRQHDLIVKRGEYLALGVQEYWIIDRLSGELLVVTPNAEQIVLRDQTYTSPLLPGFLMPLASLIDLSDKWRAAKRQSQRKGKSP